VASALHVAGEELLDEGNLHPADEPESPGLRLQGGQGPDEKATFLLPERVAPDVGQIELPVDEQEPRIRIPRGHPRELGGHQVSDGDDEVVSLLGVEGEIGLVFGVVRRLSQGALDAQIPDTPVETCVGEVVEGAVTQAAYRENHGYSLRGFATLPGPVRAGGKER